jgi:hypothetical protein
MKPDDEERQEDFSATAESLRQDARRVAEIEEEKQRLDIDDPRVDALSHEAERIAGDVQRKSRIERDLAADASPRADEAEGRAN